MDNQSCCEGSGLFRRFTSFSPQQSPLLYQQVRNIFVQNTISGLRTLRWVAISVLVLLFCMQIVIPSGVFPILSPIHNLIKPYKLEEPHIAPLKILYIITAIKEYNTNRRTSPDAYRDDRLNSTLIPVLVDGVNSMINPPYNYEVDVYLILGWELRPERRLMIEDAIPEGVGLEIWDNAIPLGYDDPGKNTITQIKRSLTRQHRYVVKDKIDHYDLFCAFEDDMLITGSHVQHFLTMNEQLKNLKEQAPEELDISGKFMKPKFYGNMTKSQISRLIPSFIRVEVLMDEKKWPSQEILDPIPVDHMFSIRNNIINNVEEYKERHIDPLPCCNTSSRMKQPHVMPSFDKIVIWETSVFAAVVRKLPTSISNLLDWVLLLPIPKNDVKDENFIDGYWAGQDGIYGNEDKPKSTAPYLFGQPAGWMETRERLIEIHERHCNYNFFPPFENSGFVQNGLHLFNTEFWSGGFQLYTNYKVGCNMQRVISLHPDHFSKHLIYHTANNKQKFMGDRIVKADNFFGQLNSVVKAAKKEKKIQNNA